ncbi:hypothetical protein BT246_66950 (plasmid) [Bacillus thuringiensis]|uniref:Uncharacterized protein n=1 Tax=Bacillus thuringiensis TaxID=1428 RepID=A0A9W3SIX9_BACTU|nr:hypothetical protein [Bacillus thuringiensis]ANS51987.1 hypothetical protein BT246_66950 [Bacillus thuringiensis]
MKQKIKNFTKSASLAAFMSWSGDVAGHFAYISNHFSNLKNMVVAYIKNSSVLFSKIK